MGIATYMYLTWTMQPLQLTLCTYALKNRSLSTRLWLHLSQLHVYVDVDMCRRLSSLWSVSQVSNSQIYEALCYLCTLSTIGQTLTFSPHKSGNSIQDLLHYQITHFGNQTSIMFTDSLHHTTK